MNEKSKALYELEDFISQNLNRNILKTFEIDKTLTIGEVTKIMEKYNIISYTIENNYKNNKVLILNNFNKAKVGF